MAMFNYIGIDDIVELDADGRLTRIRPIPEAIIARFDPTSPDDIALMNEIYSAYTGNTTRDAVQATAKWLERWDITPDDDRYEAEFERLIGAAASNRAVLAEARRVAERAELLHMTDGKMSQNCIYVNDGPDPCEECLAIGGEEMTVAEFAANRMMPGDRCLGKDNCLCILIPINKVG